MQFGSWGHFGGSSQFGGAEPRALIYYRILKDLRPPRVFSTNDDSNYCNLLRTIAELLGDHGQSLVDAFDREQIPRLICEKLPEWEVALKITPSSSATQTDRRNAVISHWRGALSLSVPDLRAQLSPILNSTTAFRDGFDDAFITSRWTVEAGAGAISEAGGSVTLSIPALAQAYWSGVGRNAPLMRIGVNDRNDSVEARALLGAFSAGAGAGGAVGGIVLWESDSDAFLFGIEGTPTGNDLVVDRIEDGVLSRRITYIAAPVWPVWLVASRSPSGYAFRYGWDLANLSTLFAIESTTIQLRDVGLALKNLSPWPTAWMQIDHFEFLHGLAQNNIEVIEAPLSGMPASAPEKKFFAFIFRKPTDPDNYDLREAQRQLNNIKPARSLYIVGESDCFRWSDPCSLWGRDIWRG